MSGFGNDDRGLPRDRVQVGVQMSCAHLRPNFAGVRQEDITPHPDGVYAVGT